MRAPVIDSIARGVLSTSALVAALVVVGCASKTDHAPFAEGCPADADCLGIGGGGGGGGGGDGGVSEVGVDADGGEVGPVDIVGGRVRAAASFMQDPATGSLDTESNLVVKGAIGATFLDGPVAGGNFSLTGLDNTFSSIGLNFVYLESRATTPAVTRTIFGFPIAPAGGAYDVDVPTFPDGLSQSLAGAAGIPLPSGSSSGTATVVVQIFDATTKLPLRGVTGAQFYSAPPPSPGSTSNPYYDDGSDGLVVSPGGTGGRGTVVWLPVNPGFLTVTLKHGTTTYQPFNAPTIANAVTFVRVGVTP